MAPQIRIVRGCATPEDLAAVIAVLHAVSASRARGPLPGGAEAVVSPRWPFAGRVHGPAGAWSTVPAAYWRHVS